MTSGWRVFSGILDVGSGFIGETQGVVKGR